MVSGNVGGRAWRQVSALAALRVDVFLDVIREYSDRAEGAGASPNLDRIVIRRPRNIRRCGRRPYRDAYRKRSPHLEISIIFFRTNSAIIGSREESVAHALCSPILARFYGQ